MGELAKAGGLGVELLHAAVVWFAAAADSLLWCSQPAPITTKSSRQALDLAGRLKESGARMYGAFWCSHCFEQKQTFGKEAMQSFPYVECFPEGWRRVSSLSGACLSSTGVPQST